VTDDNLNMYDVRKNDEPFANGTIDPEEPVITISLDGLEIGIYNFTLYANDTSGNTASNSVLVTVLGDDVIPIITYVPPDIRYAQGTTGQVYNWTATDDFKDYYEILVDGVLVFTADWTTNNIEFDFSGLLQGSHNVTLRVYDIGSNMAESTVTVFVSTSTAMVYLTWSALISAVSILIIGIVWFVRYR
jgi:hypothetical protein